MSAITWQQRIRELQASGMTLEQIGQAIGRATSAVGDLAVGRKRAPTGDAAVKLHELHRDRCYTRETRRRSAKARA